MSTETSTTASGAEGTQAQLALGATIANGAEGTQKPAAATTVSAAVETKPVEKVAEKPADDAAVKAAAETKAKADADAKATDEKKAADAKAADEKKAADDKAAADKLWSEWKPAAPKGVERDEAALKEFIPVARELGLKPEQAQKILDLSDKLEAGRVKAQKESVEKYFADQRASHLKASATDPEYGGKFDEANRVANKAFEKFVPKEALAELKALNADVMPGLFKAFWRIGQAMKNDSIAGAGGAGAGEPTEEARLRLLYPSMYPKS